MFWGLSAISSGRVGPSDRLGVKRRRRSRLPIAAPRTKTCSSRKRSVSRGSCFRSYPSEVAIDGTHSTGVRGMFLYFAAGVAGSRYLPHLGSTSSRSFWAFKRWRQFDSASFKDIASMENSLRTGYLSFAAGQLEEVPDALHECIDNSLVHLRLPLPGTSDVALRTNHSGGLPNTGPLLPKEVANGIAACLIDSVVPMVGRLVAPAAMVHADRIRDAGVLHCGREATP